MEWTRRGTHKHELFKKHSLSRYHSAAPIIVLISSPAATNSKVVTGYRYYALYFEFVLVFVLMKSHLVYAVTLFSSHTDYIVIGFNL